MTEFHHRDTDGMRSFLLADGNLGVPCSRYGRNTEECAPVAILAALIEAEANGHAVTTDGLDYFMGLVVNDHDDIEWMIREHGTTPAYDCGWRPEHE